ncbi:hypothetical protein Tco_1070084 [Tanacetum coccineum]|uniref:Uncharacterized protein n=1 Tax=Tanacetum coccineum TaxID=301880 RepID=A0ABQ5HKD8_9ASTR
MRCCSKQPEEGQEGKSCRSRGATLTSLPKDCGEIILACLRGLFSGVADASVYTAADTVTSSRGKTLVLPTSDVGGSSQPETSEESSDSFSWNVRHESLKIASVDRSSALKCSCVFTDRDTESLFLIPALHTFKSPLDVFPSTCVEAMNLIHSHVSTLHSAFSDFKEKMEAQQEAQAQELYNRVAELEAHVMDVSGRLEGEFYPAYLTTLAGRRWLLTHGRPWYFGMQDEGLAAGHEHGVAGTPLSAVVAYNPEAAESNYLDAVRALEEADFPLVHLLKSKKDSGMDEVLDCFLLDGPLADLPEAAHLQPCLEQLSVPIYHADVNAVAGLTILLSFGSS